MSAYKPLRHCAAFSVCLLVACGAAKTEDPASSGPMGQQSAGWGAAPGSRVGDSAGSGAGAVRSGGAGRPGAAAAAAGSGSGTTLSQAGQSGAGTTGAAGVPGSATAGQGQGPTAGMDGMDGMDGMMPAGAISTGDGFYHLERLDRGVVAVSDGSGVFVSWRMFGYEHDAERPERVYYELLRDGTKIAEVKDSTNFHDAQGTSSSKYSVRAVVDMVAGEPSADAAVWPEQYLRIPLDRPGGGYSANDASVADLDGDGVYEIILKWDPDNSKDNSQSGITSSVYLDALKLDGTRLWRIDLGPNIRAGAHYTQFIVFDLDDDGSAELAVKTAPGTKAGDGSYLSLGPAANDDDRAQYRNSEGYVLSGPEYLSVFAGDSGKELATVEFDVPRGRVADWGDDYGNRVDRFLATAAYLDDTGLPSFVMARGYYTRTTLTAWTFRDGALAQQWKFDSNKTPRDAQGRSYTGQGAHSLSVANVDDDPQQEIIYGAMTVDHDGQGKCSTGFNHGDALHVTDLLPDRPGLEVFMPNEDGKHPAYYVRDAGSCEVLFQGPVNGNDTGRAVAGDILPDNPGAEMWASGGTGLLAASNGRPLGDGPSSINFLIWWDGDESRELEDKTAIQKYGGGTLLSCDSCASNNGTKATPALVADILGDWREEVIWRESDSSALRLYTTKDITTRRIFTLMHDAQYRVAISWQNTAYNQPPHPSFHIGNGMRSVPKPDMRTR